MPFRLVHSLAEQRNPTRRPLRIRLCKLAVPAFLYAVAAAGCEGRGRGDAAAGVRSGPTDSAVTALDSASGPVGPGASIALENASAATSGTGANAVATPLELAQLGATLDVPVQGIPRSGLHDTFAAPRRGHVHQALDILAPRGTPVLSATDGRLLKLFRSRAGGLMVYATDASERFILLYGHLDGYAAGLRPGMRLRRRQVIGYVGTTGNAPPGTPHLHFGILRGRPSVSWSRGVAVNPYPLLSPEGLPGRCLPPPGRFARAAGNITFPGAISSPDSTKEGAVPKPVPPAPRRPSTGRACALALGLALAPPALLHAQRPPELKGSPDKLAQQNRVADEHDLTRMDGPAVIRRLVKSGYLVRVPRRGRGYYLDSKLGRGYSRREVLWYARPWVLKFLRREGEHYADRFGGARFKVSSLVRTEGYQELLKNRNVNAARGDDDDSRSPHLTGAALDISKKGMSRRQLAWMREHLVTLQDMGWIIGTEEMATNAFHVFVQPGFGAPEKSAVKMAPDSSKRPAARSARSALPKASRSKRSRGKR